MNDDATLLRRYAEEKSEGAFGELVRRHLDLVYSAALRRLGGDAHGAADVAQQVFTKLAREAAGLSRQAVLTAWLYVATRNAAVDVVRAEQRRRAREQEAHDMQTLNAAVVADAEWAKIRPVLDAAMDELSEADRTAVLLRFFEKRGYAEIGETLGLNADAARMRVERAIEKLRTLLARRGIASTAVALAMVLAEQGVIAAPVELSATVTGLALKSAAGVGSVVGAGVSVANIPTAVAVLAAVVAIGVAWLEIDAERTARVAATQAKELTAALTVRSRALALQVEAEGRRSEERRRAPAATVVQPARAVVKTAEVEPDANVLGQEFLSAHPEMNETLARMRRRIIDSNWGLALRGMGLSAEERAQILGAVVDAIPWAFSVSERGWRDASGTEREEMLRNMAEGGRRLQEVLGEARFDQFREAYAREGIYALAQAVAVASYESGAPLTAAQTSALVDAVVGNGAKRVGGLTGTMLPEAGLTRLKLNTVDWPAVTRSLAGTLSPTQLAALEAGRASAAAQEREGSAKRRISTPAPAGTKPGGE